MKTALGIDIGTTSLSLVLLAGDRTLLRSLTRPTEAFLTGEPYERIQSPGKIWELLVSSLAGLTEGIGRIDCVGVTGQMHGILCLDRNGEPLTPLYTWQDERGSLPYDDTRSWAEYFAGITGYPAASGYGLVTLGYNTAKGLVPENTAAVCTIHDYIAMKLCGRTSPVTDASDAASLGFFDLRNRRFDPDAVKKLGIDPALLPSVPKDPLVGHYDCRGQKVPVFCAIGDNQASFIGGTGGDFSLPLINVGTGSQVSVYSPDYVRVEGIETRPFGDGYLLVGAPLCGGRSFALLEKFFRQTAALAGAPQDSLYPAINRLLAEAPVPEDIPTFVTAFCGTREDPARRGSVTGLTTENFTPLHFLYGMMEGMAEELSGYYSLCVAGRPAPKAAAGSGNGLRNNPVLCRIVEKKLGIPLVLSPYREEAACGAAIRAMSLL